MFIELIDLLRCPSDHEESWLVAALDKTNGRVVINGRLGCPVCGAEYPVRDGVAVFGDGRAAATADVDAWRIAAFLDLRSPGKVVVLLGGPAALARQLIDSFGARVVLVDGREAIEPGENLALVRASDASPLRGAAADGIVLGAGAAREDVANAARVLRSGGRIVLPASAPTPGGFDQLAADEHHRVLRKREVPAPVPLTRA